MRHFVHSDLFFSDIQAFIHQTQKSSTNNPDANMKADISNPWHKVEIGQDAPHVVNGIIEIPKNTRAKYELDKDSGLLLMDVFGAHQIN